MYRIDVDDEVREQVAALPDALVPHFLQLMDVLELVPWNSEPYNDANPDGMRAVCRRILKSDPLEYRES
jgi:hypothetical protein